MMASCSSIAVMRSASFSSMAGKSSLSGMGSPYVRFRYALTSRLASRAISCTTATRSCYSTHGSMNQADHRLDGLVEVEGGGVEGGDTVRSVHKVDDPGILGVPGRHLPAHVLGRLAGDLGGTPRHSSFLAGGQ